MINLKLFFFLILIFFSTYSLANKIAVIDIGEIIDSNKYYLKIVEKIENNKIKSSSFLKDEELQLEDLYKKIEESKILLSEIELSNLINEYNTNYNKFSIKVKDYNEHFQNQILKIRKIILKEIIVLSEKYAKKNNIDLILDSSSYLIASNEINMTKTIKKQLEKIILKLEYKNFEKN